MPAPYRLLFLLTLVIGLATGWHAPPDGFGPGPSVALADDDDDDGGGDDDDDDDGGGGSVGGGGGGGGSLGGSGSDQSRIVPVVPAALPRLAMPRSESDRARQAEISGAGLTAANVAALQQRGFQVVRAQQISTLGNTQAVRFRTPPQLTPQAALQIARQTVPGAVFDFSHLYQPGQGNPLYAREMVQISATPGCGRGVRVGLVDTTVGQHASLQSARVVRRSFSAGRADSRHGTAVASLLVGRDPSGRSTLDGAQLYAASVFSTEGSALNADAIDIVAAIDWLLGQGVQVVNVSITGPANALVQTAVEAAAARGMIIVAAGGNGDARGAPRYPAAYPQVIAVSAVDRRTRPYNFNTRGSYIDLAAPGVDVWAADAATGGGALWSGTSFAAPFVTVAVAKAVRGGQVRNVTEARRMLASQARDLGPSGRDPVYGYGLLQSSGC